MALFTKKGQKSSDAGKEGLRKFIDLNDYKFPAEQAEARNVVRVAEIGELDDLRKVNDLIYNNNILILDCSAIVNDEFSMSRIKEELKRAVSDVNGDIAAINRSYLLVTPPGIPIDRRKVK
ncbi:MAG: cell division protein SepF [Candidatus Thermoplasmatota archaeon]|jgi:SepF-like predicted cell division protein (DUF552 family)|nr:cell division protein SepF [Candidatus Thermoplasmatota archaeon]